jgi:phosphatidylglycerophosphatase A
MSIRLLKNPVHLLAFGFGSGLSPYAPGTIGTLVGVVLFVACYLADPVYNLVSTAIVILGGIWIAGKSAHQLGHHDDQRIVIDEVAGYMVTMLFIPVDWMTITAGFVLFRIFDILKPWPIRLVDRQVKGGFGIMLDDLIAGVFANIVLQIVVWSAK